MAGQNDAFCAILVAVKLAFAQQQRRKNYKESRLFLCH